jgi:hypothetical protein
MSQVVDALAEDLRAAATESPETFTTCLAGLWADEVATAHEPPRDIDGQRSRDQQVEMHRRQDAAFRRAMADYRQEAVVVQAGGDCIELAATITGTGGGGSVASLPVRWRFIVRDGRIHGVVTIVDPAGALSMVKILNEAGIQMPD